MKKEKMVRLKCELCKKMVKVTQEAHKWSAWARCSCGGRAWEPDFVPQGPVKNRGNGTNWR